MKELLRQWIMIVDGRAGFKLNHGSALILPAGYCRTAWGRSSAYNKVISGHSLDTFLPRLVSDTDPLDTRHHVFRSVTTHVLSKIIAKRDPQLPALLYRVSARPQRATLLQMLISVWVSLRRVFL